ATSYDGSRRVESQARERRSHGRRLDLEPAVSAAVEDQRLGVRRVPELDDTTHDDHVIAGVVFVSGLAIDEGERVPQDRRAGPAERVADVCETIDTALREQATRLFAVLGEDVRRP